MVIAIGQEWQDNLYKLDNAPTTLDKKIVTQMLSRDLFAVSDLLLYLSPCSSYAEIHS